MGLMFYSIIHSKLWIAVFKCHTDKEKGFEVSEIKGLIRQSSFFPQINVLFLETLYDGKTWYSFIIFCYDIVMSSVMCIII